MDWRLLGVALVILAAVAHRARQRDTRATAAVLTVDWALCALAVHHTGSAYPAVWFFLIDYPAALCILIFAPMHYGRRPHLWEGLVGAIYAVELISHAARYMRPGQASLYYGYYFLMGAAWMQALVVSVWLIYAMACRRDWLGGRLSRHDAFLGGYQARRATEKGCA